MKLLAVLPLLLAFAGSKLAQQQYRHVIEVSRHGSREPSDLFNFTKDPSLNFNGTSNLTPYGRSQHYRLGQSLRKRYAELIETAADCMVKSTDTNRTYVSATYQLMGMFPELIPSEEDIKKFEIG